MEGIDYGVRLEDGMSGPATQAARAGDALSDSLGHLKDHAEESHSVMSKLSEGFIRTVEPAEVLKGAFEGVGEGIKSFAAGLKSGEAKEMITGIAEAAAGLAQTLDLLVPGLGQLAAAAIKVAGAFAAMTAGLIQAGAELAIEATLGKLAMVSMFAALGGGQKVGEETEEMLSSLSDQIGITKDTLAPFTRAFMAMGIEGTEALKKVTLAAISAQAIMGDPAAAHAFENLTKKIQIAAETGHGLKIPEKGLKSLAEMGLRVDDVAKRLNVDAHTLSAQLKAGTVNAVAFGEALQDALIAKGAGPLDRMGKSLGNLKKIFGQSIEDLFEDMGPAIEPFLEKVGQLLNLFSQSEESGRTMKSALGGAFTYIFEVATESIVPIGNFFLDLEYYSIRAYTLIKSHWLSIKMVFADIQPGLDALRISFEAIGHVLDTIGKADAAFDRLKVMLGGGLRDVGKAGGGSLAEGLADGIADGGKKVSGAAAGLGQEAKGGVTDALQIHSPSRVGFQIGGQLGEGVALGMNASQPQIGQSARDMGNAAVPGADGGGKGGSTSVQGGIHITIQAPDGVTHASELTEVGLALVFERLALSQGAL